MSDDTLMDIAITLGLLWVLYVVWLIWIRPLWVNRRQPIRKDGPTGGPWVKPEPRKWKDTA